MTKKELNKEIVNAVEHVLKIHNGYLAHEIFIVDDGREIYYTVSPLHDNEEVIYCIDPEGLNSQIDPVIDELESMLEDEDLIGLKNLAVEIAGSYISCDDDYYDIVRDLETETEEDILQKYANEF